VHGLAVILVRLLASARLISEKQCGWVNNLFTLGIIIFSGSLYLLAITGERWLGMITPVGGISFIAAWFLLGAVLLRKDN
jgi:uncharacterized membrane protein YgdD (TMEM256/DUF423 family)